MVGLDPERDAGSRWQLVCASGDACLGSSQTLCNVMLSGPMTFNARFELRLRELRMANVHKHAASS
jgi:hypothetical protein